MVTTPQTSETWWQEHVGYLLDQSGEVPDGGSDEGDETGAVPGDRPDLVGDVGAVAVALAQLLGRLHQLPTNDVPFGGDWETVSARVQAGGVDAAGLPEPYCRYDTERLTELWIESRPANDELVVCHGSPELSTMRFIEGRLVGIEPPDRLCLADRHLDLAIAQQSLSKHLGPESVFVFYDAYPVQPDLVRLDHYVLASLLGG